MQKTSIISKIIIYFVLGILFLVVIYPLFWIVITSFKDNWAVFQDPTGLPLKPTFQNYLKVWTMGDFGLYFTNSIIITSISLLGVLFLAAAAGYGFARYRFRSSDTLFFVFMLSLVIVSSSIMIAQYRWISFLGLLNTIPGIILVYLSWTAFGIIMFRQAFSELPQEIVDAAIIDGCSELGIFIRIALPLVRPTIATVAIFTFVWIWNDFIWPLILLQDPSKQTATLGLLSLRGMYLADWAILSAGLVITFMPVLVIYFVLQRHFVQGLTMGALKG